MQMQRSDDHAMPAGLLTVREASRLLSVHPNTLRRWSDLGMVRAFRLGSRRDRRFRPEDIAHLVEDNRFVPA